MSDNLLEIDGLQTFIGQFHILEGVDVTVPRNQVTVLLGRNGAGKTTTLKSIMGIHPPAEGQISYQGQSIAGRRPYDVAQMGIGYVPEHRAVFGTLTVKENLELAQGIIERDKEVDRLNKENFKTLSKDMKGENGAASTQIETILISKSIERIADHAKNLAEEVIYLLTGE